MQTFGSVCHSQWCCFQSWSPDRIGSCRGSADDLPRAPSWDTWRWHPASCKPSDQQRSVLSKDPREGKTLIKLLVQSCLLWLTLRRARYSLLAARHFGFTPGPRGVWYSFTRVINSGGMVGAGPGVTTYYRVWQVIRSGLNYITVPWVVVVSSPAKCECKDETNNRFNNKFSSMLAT